MVDSIVLMAVIQRDLFNELRSGWADEELARDLNLNPEDIARTQNTLNCIAHAAGHPAALGGRLWQSSDAADEPGSSVI